ncbi:hypothetical protein KCP74_16235 [Salmonella enterica subsp. enterica]|nr:hypothetical protein KCP74_16235 [Salmonella enterica subsp. enterica]
MDALLKQLTIGDLSPASIASFRHALKSVAAIVRWCSNALTDGENRTLCGPVSFILQRKIRVS